MDFGSLDREMDFGNLDREMDREMHQLEMSAGRHGAKSFSESESREITEVNGKVHEKDTKCVNGKCKERVSNHRAMHAHMPAHVHARSPARIPPHIFDPVPVVLAETSSNSMYALLAGVIGFFVGSVATFVLFGGRRASTEGDQPLLSA